MIDKKTAILNSARELFAAKGFKDTNVSEIMKHAGMATGTFYNYFLSKDKLFMEIFLEENVALKKRIMSEIDLEGHPMEVMGQLMMLNEMGMREHSILKEWYNKDVYSRIEQAYREVNGIEHVDFMYDAFIAIVKKWQDENKFRRDIEPEMIMAIFSALANIDTHKEEVGIQYFPKVVEFISEFTLRGLMET